jgi:hypothetical protein
MGPDMPKFMARSSETTPTRDLPLLPDSVVGEQCFTLARLTL